ncbi:MAG: MnmC family methyltransferase [Cyanobacteria bacterium]|nr:MnmC family methyltransferase [Cyanobacteriota bacterium]
MAEGDGAGLSVVRTADGSVTFRSERFGEHFHSLQGAWREAIAKFVLPTGLVGLAGDRGRCGEPIVLLDVCYGLGYNTAAALGAIWMADPACRVRWFGLELDGAVPRAAIAPLREYLAAQVAAGELSAAVADRVGAVVESVAVAGVATDPAGAMGGGFVPITGSLLLGDARQTVAQVAEAMAADGVGADAIFFDPFSPPRCPQLWTVEFIGAIAACLAPTGRLATYSCAPAVRAALQLAGLTVGPSEPFGRRWPGTIAAIAPEPPFDPLDPREQEHLQTRAAVPYRDPTLADSADMILERRDREQAASPLEPTSRWKRRWFGDCRAKF